jgi:hypothetical protein
MNIIIFVFVFLLLIILYFIYNLEFFIINDNNLQKYELQNYLNNDNILLIFKTILQDINYNNIIIYTNFDNINSEYINSNNRKLNNTLIIQYSGESYYNEPNNYDINFIPSKPNNNNIVFPLGYLYLLDKKLDSNYFINNRTYYKKDKFCIFIVSNGACHQRNDFFNKLCEYKKVDSYGVHLNNMNKILEHNFWTPEFLDILKQYKFMICFENKTSEYYLTEKLINAYYSDTIPIYWGCPQTEEWINTDSIIYIKPEYNEEQINQTINEIILLDNNDELYKQKYENTFFRNGIPPDEFNIDKIKEKVELLLNNK